MRATGRLCALLCALLAVLPAAAAQAKITPVPKPAGLVPKPGAVRGTSLIAPVSKPARHASIATHHARIARAPRRAPHRAALTVRHRIAPAKSHGGREAAWRVLSLGGRVAAAVAPLVPTPLGVVGRGEALPVYRSDWAAWKIGVLALFAVAELFVLAGIAREAHLARAAEFA
jgi:hypothetical protein